MAAQPVVWLGAAVGTDPRPMTDIGSPFWTDLVYDQMPIQLAFRLERVEDASGREFTSFGDWRAFIGAVDVTLLLQHQEGPLSGMPLRWVEDALMAAASAEVSAQESERREEVFHA